MAWQIQKYRKCLLAQKYSKKADNTVAHLHAGEADADEEVGHPVDEHRDGHRRRPRSLREQLGRDHPRDGARAHREEDHEAEGGHHRQVRHPVYHLLHVAKKLLSGGRITVLSRQGGVIAFKIKFWLGCERGTGSVCLKVVLFLY